MFADVTSFCAEHASFVVGAASLDESWFPTATFIGVVLLDVPSSAGDSSVSVLKPGSLKSFIGGFVEYVGWRSLQIAQLNIVLSLSSPSRHRTTVHISRVVRFRQGDYDVGFRARCLWTYSDIDIWRSVPVVACTCTAQSSSTMTPTMTSSVFSLNSTTLTPCSGSCDWSASRRTKLCSISAIWYTHDVILCGV